jgi:hypothetical protein
LVVSGADQVPACGAPASFQQPLHQRCEASAAAFEGGRLAVLILDGVAVEQDQGGVHGAADEALGSDLRVGVRSARPWSPIWFYNRLQPPTG